MLFGEPGSPQHALTRAMVTGVIAVTVLEVHFYSSGGCSSEQEAREDYGHQISNQMCCVTEWVVGAIGLGGCGILVLCGVPLVYRAPRGLFGRSLSSAVRLSLRGAVQVLLLSRHWHGQC